MVASNTLIIGSLVLFLEFLEFLLVPSLGPVLILLVRFYLFLRCCLGSFQKEIKNDNKILKVNDEIIVQIKHEDGTMLTVPACHAADAAASTAASTAARTAASTAAVSTAALPTAASTTTAASISNNALSTAVHLDVDEVYEGNHFIFHTAVEGDTLLALSHKYAPTTPCELRVWNELQTTTNNGGTDSDAALTVGEEYIVHINGKDGRTIAVPRCHGEGVAKAKEEQRTETQHNQQDARITELANQFSCSR